MNPSQRIAFNTIATYIRSVIGAGLALFSSRWVLNALGQTDYGLFNLVGSIIVFITFVNAVLAGSVARHYAYAIGQGDLDEVKRWFNTAWSIHLLLSGILVIIGWPIGEYVCVHYLTIPQDRLSACLWVFRLSLISAFASMVSVPFIAMFTAKQCIALLAVWNMLYSVMVFALSWFLRYITFDRFIFYAVGMVGIHVFINLVQISWAKVVFSECQFHCRQWFDKQRINKIISFAGWNLIGSCGTVLRNQGSAILLNVHFGPKLNAAYGIANQVSSQTDQLAAAMIGAFSPEIITSEGRGDRSRMLAYAQRASKFGTILVLLFAIPLLIDMDYVLRLWLIEPPLHTALLCRLILITFVIDRLTVGNLMAVMAYGKIAAYQLTVGVCMFLTLPLVWVLFKLGAPPTSVGAAFIATMLAVSAGRIFWIRQFFGVPINEWIRKVFFPCAAIGLGGVLAALAVKQLMSVSIVRLACILFMNTLLILFSGWFLALDRDERQFFRHNWDCFISKISILRNPV